MLRHMVFLLFLYGIKNCIGSSDETHERTLGAKDVSQNGIKKNEVGANGLEANLEKVLRNFRNPVLEYLLHTMSDRANEPPKKGVVREIRHSQTLLLPNSLRTPLPGIIINHLPQFEFKPDEEVTRDPESSPLDNFWNFLKNETQTGGNKTYESVVTSPVLHLSKDANKMNEEATSIQTYPAVAVVINTFNRDGSLKNSVTHFQPDFNSLKQLKPDTNDIEATYATHGKKANKYNSVINNSQYTVQNFVKGDQNEFPQGSPNQGGLQAFANHFPIVMNHPRSSVYNTFSTSLYNTVSSVIEYGPEADPCLKDKVRDSGSATVNPSPLGLNKRATSQVLDGYIDRDLKADIFDEVTMKSEGLKGFNRKLFTKVNEAESFERKRRDATSILVKSREGGTVGITLKESTDANDEAANSQDERARSFSSALINTPPLSTILRPPQQESRQFLGYADKKKKTKPSKPAKEEGSSEEIGEEHEEESTSQSQENANEAVAISPPPEGASVAEAKPIGLAIAGPGGVAASKPQGTAVAGPGGLAIARPVGTAIAGVDVEGSVPIGGQQKNKKKPKQEQEQTEAELHYVGGLTGPIGNPQPKEFSDSIYYKTVKDTQGNNIQENLFFRGVPKGNGFQLRLGQINGKYGFIPALASPAQEENRPQKRTDFSTFFHGLLGNGAQGNDQFEKYHTQF